MDPNESNPSVVAMATVSVAKPERKTRKGRPPVKNRRYESRKPRNPDSPGGSESLFDSQRAERRRLRKRTRREKRFFMANKEGPSDDTENSESGTAPLVAFDGKSPGDGSEDGSEDEKMFLDTDSESRTEGDDDNSGSEGSPSSSHTEDADDSLYDSPSIGSDTTNSTAVHREGCQGSRRTRGLYSMGQWMNNPVSSTYTPGLGESRAQLGSTLDDIVNRISAPDQYAEELELSESEVEDEASEGKEKPFDERQGED